MPRRMNESTRLGRAGAEWSSIASSSTETSACLTPAAGRAASRRSCWRGGADGRVICLDLIEIYHLAGGARFADEPRVELVVADLTHPLPIDEPVDAILSTATFHWMTDHPSLFLEPRLRAATARAAGRAMRRSRGTSRRSCGPLRGWVSRSAAGRRWRRRRRPGPGWRWRASLERHRHVAERRAHPDTRGRSISRGSCRPCAWAESPTTSAKTNARVSSTRSRPGCPNRSVTYVRPNITARRVG